MPLSYPKMNIRSERILSFCTLNEHILLVKGVSDETQSLGNNVYRVHTNTPDTNILNLCSYNSILMGF